MERPVEGRRRRRQEGFTLIELGVVLAIIAILVAIAVPTYLNMTQRARQAEAAQAWDMVKSEVWTYYLQNNAFPPASSGTWPTGIDDPNPTSKYWDYSVSSSTYAFTFTASPKANYSGSSLQWTLHNDGSVTQP
ncbi:MAG: prepilin-type N-terminal cleavage/methylation domain-containing protein [Firmicutes bacterium]|nr:prepilin-type N-terminal cleavage/methylation domain-containing protein [Bacillota bacterium]